MSLGSSGEIEDTVRGSEGSCGRSSRQKWSSLKGTSKALIPPRPGTGKCSTICSHKDCGGGDRGCQCSQHTTSWKDLIVQDPWKCVQQCRRQGGRGWVSLPPSRGQKEKKQDASSVTRQGRKVESVWELEEQEMEGNFYSSDLAIWNFTSLTILFEY